MASLALAAALVMVSVWGLAGLSLLLSFVGFGGLGAFFGVLSVAAGVWLLCVLPHVPFLGLVNIVAGGLAVRRYFKEKR